MSIPNSRSGPYPNGEFRPDPNNPKDYDQQYKDAMKEQETFEINEANGVYGD